MALNDFYHDRYDEFDITPCFNEVVINGKRMTYDGCSTKILSEAQKFYTPDKWVYLGESKTTYHDGVENNWLGIHHFFNLKK